MFPIPIRRAGLIAAAMISAAVPAQAQSQTQTQERELPVYRQTDAPLDARVADALSRMTLDEKIALFGGAGSMTLHGVPRLEIPGIRVTDGPTGVRSAEGRSATVFLVGVALAATWNPDLAGRVGAAIAQEVRAHGASVLLAPTVNIVRTPRWGRNFETYSEDPFLTAQIGLGYVRGVQGQGIGISLKHFAANNQETNRFFVDARLAPRTLRELYLPAFETIVKDAEPWSVMASYNKLNGTYASENPVLLTEILKEQWGFDGMVVSDWGATHSTAGAFNAGLDLEMPGPPNHYGAKLRAAVDAGEVPMARVDDGATRMLRLIFRSGVVDDGPVEPGDSPDNAAVARAAAEEAIVLLKNSGVLPLDPAIRTLAVIGPNANVVRVQGGGSSEVVPRDAIPTPLEAIRAALPGVAVVYEQGVDSEELPPVARPDLLSPTRDREAEGLTASYFAAADRAGEPLRTEVETRFMKRVSANVAGADAIGFRALRWEGFFWPEVSGTYAFSLRGTGKGSLTLDGETIITPETASTPDPRDVIGFPVPRRTVSVELEAGRGYPIRIDYANGNTLYEAVTFGVRTPAPSYDAAIAAARRADAAVVLVGSSSMTEGEGYDRQTLALPGEQDRLVADVVAANPRTAVVVNSGAAMLMPWKDAAPAILQSWLPGQEGAAALAAILTGAVNPSGRLPVTFPARDADDPIDLSAREAPYSDGLLVGYRAFDARGATPLFAFGHGLSYTDFAYSDLRVPARIGGGEDVSVRVRVRNTGPRAGKEVVQLYIAPETPGEGDPVKTLQAFAKVAIAPGATETVRLRVSPRAFAAWDEESGSWRVKPGSYRVIVARSAADARASATIEVRGGAATVQ